MKGIVNKSADIMLIPQPSALDFYSGIFHLNNCIDIYTNDSDLQASAKFISASLFKDKVCQQIEEPANANISLLLKSSAKQGDHEAYRLIIDDNGVTISASSTAGIFYGLQSLNQIYYQAGDSLPYLVITDSPRFAYRGMHLDVSRHFLSVEFIKRYIDLIAFHKMNVFHWHLTDDQGWRIEIKAYPKLTEVGAWREQTVVGHTSNSNVHFDGRRHGGFYTQQQIKEIVAYADQRHITIIPELDIPGHAAALLAAYPELACDLDNKNFKVQTRFGIFTDVLCAKPETFEFLAVVLAEVAELFPGAYVHIGGDEVKKKRWHECSYCQSVLATLNTDDYEALHGYFIEQVEAIARKLDKKLIGWDEVLDADVDSSTTIMSWQGIAGGKQAAIKGHQVVMTPVDALYFDFYQATSCDEPMAIHGLTPLKKVYEYEPVPEGLTVAQQKNILGAQANVWTEYMSTPSGLSIWYCRG
ncbi:beta-N-acetylhexosaminidase [Oceanicoccus sp. KOV_DT_Chl]|uniref:beta-N-acetylhexosaminidase n=1 Tax=Oceanicoccus sp. KOV_DT_Chl TaxID=1904639 RepID=UPI000C7DFBB5|nr:beta-N-acetylhexosaminidase [Oceanicoccus sp. KOV_DT_Chl]